MQENDASLTMTRKSSTIEDSPACVQVDLDMLREVTSSAGSSPHARVFIHCRCSCLHMQVDLDTLRELTWSGCPPPLRADCWRLLLGYLPPSRDRRWGFRV